MSHFSVAVITKGEPTYEQIDSMLAPYSENISVAPYISETKEQYLEQKRKSLEDYKNGTYAEYIKCPAAYEAKCSNEAHIEYLKNFMNVYNSTDEELLTERDANYLHEGDKDLSVDEPYLDKNGNLISTYNPKSKWDWWTIGGRWQGLLNLTNDDEEYYNSARIKNVNFNENPDIETLKEQYKDEYEKLITEGDFYRAEYYQKRYPTIEDYIFSITSFSTYAVLNEDGWHEKGEMYYFGITGASEKDKLNWEKNFFSTFIKKCKESKDDYWITIVDCHI